MSVPTQDHLKAQIAEKVGLPITKVDEVLTGQGVSRGAVSPANRTVDISRISTAEDVNVDTARQGTGGISGMQDLCTADLQVAARRSLLALVEQIERQGI